MSWTLVFTLMLVVLSTAPARALDSTQVLPEKINSPQLRMGVVSGIGQKYTNSGDLVTLSDYHSIEFDSRTLQELDEVGAQVRQLVNVLNQYGYQRFGDELNLGVLRLETNPEIRYVAPLHACGINDKLTIAFGVPIIRYNNRITMSETNSNVGSIRALTSGSSGPAELESAFDRLQMSLVNTVQTQLAEKGYKPLESRSEQIVGDVQLAALLNFHKTTRHAWTWKSILALPTGPGDDPDDLADLGIFGQTALDQTIVYNYLPTSRLTLAGKGGYRFVLPDLAEKRVPRHDKDSLPDASTKEWVNRKTGDSIQLDASFSYEFIRNWRAGAGYQVVYKSADKYAGGQGRRYDLLGRDTQSEAHRTRLGVSFDTVNAYMAKQAMIPAIISYEFVDTIRGVNIERQTIHELWLTLFF